MKKFFFVILFYLYLMVGNSFADTTCVHFPGVSENIFVRPTLANHISTAHFKIHWENPTTAAYAQNSADYAEYAYQKMCVEMGWQVPPADDNRGGDDKYDIYLVNPDYLFNRYNGATQPEIFGNWQFEWAPSFVLIRNNIETTEQLKMIVAHELNHATQIAYSCIDGSTDTWFLENTAVWVAEMVYNYAYNYYQGYFAGPDPLDSPEFGIHTTWPELGFYKYAGFLWPKFLAEWKNDNTIVRKIWQRLGQNPGDNILPDIDFVLSGPEYESSLIEAAKYYAEWRYFTGTRDDGFHFINAYELPTSTIFSSSQSQRIDGLGGTKYIQFNPSEEIIDITFNGDDYVSWSADIIQHKNTPPSIHSSIPLNSLNDGSMEVFTEDCDYIVLSPILLTDATKKNFTHSATMIDARRVFFYNKKGATVVIGNLMIDNTTVIPSGDSKWLIVSPALRPIKTLNERYQDSPLYKHNNWNELADRFLLNSNFKVQGYNIDQSANFIPSYPATVRNVIDGISFNDALPIWFNDPWYVKDQFDNQSGMGDFISPLSPYYPTGKYNETTGGVFLNQEYDPNGQIPFYKVRSPITQDAPLTQTGKTHKFYFQSWDFSGTDPLTQNNIVNGFYESPVVFRNLSASVQANLKGTQLSNSPSAYSNNSQRKIVRTVNGDLHNVYVSMDRVWYERSTDNGNSWSTCNRRSAF